MVYLDISEDFTPWVTELRWDETTVECFFFFKESTENANQSF